MNNPQLKASEEFPASVNELYDDEGELVMILYTHELVDLPEGLWLSTEGYYEAVKKKSEIQIEDALFCISELNAITGIQYELALS